jgi:predicted dehydrogenase
MLAGAAATALSSAAPVSLGRKIRLAMWGLDGHPGDITKPLAQYPDVELVGVQDWNQAAARKTAGGKAQVFTDARKMLDEVKPDVVAINNNTGERAAAIV